MQNSNVLDSVDRECGRLASEELESTLAGDPELRAAMAAITDRDWRRAVETADADADNAATQPGKPVRSPIRIR